MQNKIYVGRKKKHVHNGNTCTIQCHKLIFLNAVMQSHISTVVIYTTTGVTVCCLRRREYSGIEVCGSVDLLWSWLQYR
jgi:hypothetical protein